jgi:hypothetical protein
MLPFTNKMLVIPNQEMLVIANKCLSFRTGEAGEEPAVRVHHQTLAPHNVRLHNRGRAALQRRVDCFSQRPTPNSQQATDHWPLPTNSRSAAPTRSARISDSPIKHA